MSVDAQQKAEEYKAVIEGKIQKIVAEFAEGKISREQFHVLYERYSGRLAIADHALLSGNPDAISIAQSGPPTIAVRSAYMGKAMGMLVYHTRSQCILETLGEFGVANEHYQMILNNPINERRSEKLDDRDWLLFVPGEFTVVVVLFHNEPSQMQIREIERLHRDFEQANRPVLVQSPVDPDRLAYPFLVFVKRWSRK